MKEVNLRLPDENRCGIIEYNTLDILDKINVEQFLNNIISQTEITILNHSDNKLNFTCENRILDQKQLFNVMSVVAEIEYTLKNVIINIEGDSRVYHPLTVILAYRFMYDCKKEGYKS